MSSSSERKAPLFVYRGDGREPKEIFRDGFSAKGGPSGDDSVLAHVEGGSNLQKTGLISTSQSLRIPPIFMQPVPKLVNGKPAYDTYTAKDGKIYIYRKGWIYHINPKNLSMVYVPDKLSGNMKLLFEYQQEWAVKDHIPGKNIKLAQRFEGYIYRDDRLDGLGAFALSPPEKPNPFHETVNNPNYAP